MILLLLVFSSSLNVSTRFLMSRSRLGLGIFIFVSSQSRLDQGKSQGYLALPSKPCLEKKIFIRGVYSNDNCSPNKWTFGCSANMSRANDFLHRFVRLIHFLILFITVFSWTVRLVHEPSGVFTTAFKEIGKRFFGQYLKWLFGIFLVLLFLSLL